MNKVTFVKVDADWGRSFLWLGDLHLSYRIQPLGQQTSPSPLCRPGIKDMWHPNLNVLIVTLMCTNIVRLSLWKGFNGTKFTISTLIFRMAVPGLAMQVKKRQTRVQIHLHLLNSCFDQPCVLFLISMLQWITWHLESVFPCTGHLNAIPLFMESFTGSIVLLDTRCKHML